MVYQVRRPFIGVVKYDGVINGGTVTPHASFNFVVAHHCKMVEGGPWCECMYCLPTRRKTRVWKGIVGIRNWPNNSRAGFGKTQNMRDSTAAREERFTKILARDAILGKKTIFGMEMTEVRDAGIPRDCHGKERECGMRTLFPDPEKQGCQKCKGTIRGTQRLLSVKYLFERKQILPRISITWGRQKNFQMTVPFMYNFRSLCSKFLTIFWSFILHILLLRLGYFSYCSKKET